MPSLSEKRFGIYILDKYSDDNGYIYVQLWVVIVGSLSDDQGYYVAFAIHSAVRSLSDDTDEYSDYAPFVNLLYMFELHYTAWLNCVCVCVLAAFLDTEERLVAISRTVWTGNCSAREGRGY